MFVTGLIVSPSELQNQSGDAGSGPSSSPFIVAFRNAGIRVVRRKILSTNLMLTGVVSLQLPHMTNAAILVSAWSAAASDIYISSRFLFFLARCHHAPSFLASLLKYPHDSTPISSEDTSDDDSDDDTSSVINIRATGSDMTAIPAVIPAALYTPQPRLLAQDIEATARTTKPWLVIPMWTILISSSIGLLSFTSSQNGAKRVGCLLYLCEIFADSLQGVPMALCRCQRSITPVMDRNAVHVY